MSNLPWFMDLTSQVPMQYCSLQLWILLSSPDPSTTGHHFLFGPATSFFLGLLVVVLCSSPVTYWTPSNLGDSSFSHNLFVFLYSSWNSHSEYTGVFCHFLLQWIIFCQNPPLWTICLEWPCAALLIVSLSYANSFTTTRQWSMKWNEKKRERDRAKYIKIRNAKKESQLTPQKCKES